MNTASEIYAKVHKQTEGHAKDSLYVIYTAMTEFAQAYHEEKTRWVSVEERLPEVDNKANPFGERIDCLVVYDGYVYKGQYMNIGEPFWSVSHICSSSSLNVTKWMLLPKP